MIYFSFFVFRGFSWFLERYVYKVWLTYICLVFVFGLALGLV